MDRPDIWASEVSDYAFCARSWWLKRVRGVTAQSERLHGGTAAHEAVGRRVAKVVRVNRTVKLMAWLLVMLVVGLLLLLAGCATGGPPGESWLSYDSGPRPNHGPQRRYEYGEYRDAVEYHRWLRDRTTIYGWPGGSRGR